MYCCGRYNIWVSIYVCLELSIYVNFFFCFIYVKRWSCIKIDKKKLYDIMKSVDWWSILNYVLLLYFKSCFGEEIFLNLKDSKLYIYVIGSLWSISILCNIFDFSNVVVKVI